MANFVAVRGIDVSTHQGRVDWDRVKASGVAFAILRCGYGSDMPTQDDKQFARNVAECERVGMPYGVYLYSYATNIGMAESEARHVLRLLEGKKPQYPIYYDLEDGGTTGRCDNATILKIAQTFVETLEAAGYWAGIYANLHWHNTRLTDAWYDGKARWVAQYNDRCTYRGPYGMWQYASDGKIDGIAGGVDMNWCYKNYPAALAAHYAAPGDANSDGVVDTADAVLALQYAAGLIGDDAINVRAADVNGDGKVDTADAALILQKTAKQ